MYNRTERVTKQTHTTLREKCVISGCYTQHLKSSGVASNNECHKLDADDLDGNAI